MTRNNNKSGRPGSGKPGAGRSGEGRSGAGQSGPNPRAGDKRRGAGRTAGDASRQRPERSLQRQPEQRGPGNHGANAAAPAPRTRREPKASGAAAASMLWGYHTVHAALLSPRRKITGLFLTPAAATRLEAEIAAKKITPAIMEPAELDRMLPAGAVHQGIAARVEPLAQPDISELPADGFVLVLDQVTDPHNLGAIVRSAAAFALSAIIMTERNAPPLAGVVAKSASGGLEHVPVITVVNLARAMEELGRLGYWRVGLDSDGQENLDDTSLTRPLALALGAEGKGLRRLTRENCDVIARLDMPGAIRSLNVSNACAVALALASRRTRK